MKVKYPVFFPDATRAVLKTLDSRDIEETKTPGILVNTYHLYKDLGKKVIKAHGGVKGFMDWKGAVISDSGGFQINTLGSKVTDLLTPEKSIAFQFLLKTDMVVVLDDFTPPKANQETAEKTVTNTIEWAKRSREEYERQVKKTGHKPLILGVVQGGSFQDLRKKCAEELLKIGFDGFGYGGWPISPDGNFDYESAKTIADAAPKDYL